MDELLSYRAQFPILEKTTYLINHSLGAMPAKTYDRMHAYAETWATRGIRAWAEGWWEMPGTIGDKVARILGADPGTVVMHQNVSVCQALILSCFDLTGKRNKIVYEALNFPSVMYVYEAHAKAAHARIVEVPSDDGITIDTQRMLDAIDEETLLVPISHVLFKSAFIQDAAAIVEKAHRVGALVVLDVYQSAGTVPFSVKDLDVDFATGGSVKWLCGGPGAGFLYVKPELRERLQPKITGWAAHKAPFAFVPGEIEYAEDAHRFLHGSPAIPALYAAESGYDLINEIGVERIRAKSMRQTARLIELAGAHGWRVNAPREPARRGGSVILDVPHAGEVVRELAAREVLVDYRPGAGVRIGPHFFSSDDELEAVVAEIKSILDTRAYEKHTAASGARF
ncbi:MAG: aminotransferase class V-fold PLP-dependent enzyme [Acidobacteria bacterium]|nr:aminotransferase class V-fold PLP-dependent enzyme [Acidobacteriota bacterium]MBI3427847.1 aminotransferase class V-fold PLP-dependent enzyme [Acidobacteriota bacterium]